MSSAEPSRGRDGHPHGDLDGGRGGGGAVAAGRPDAVVRQVPWTTRAILAVVVLASGVAGWFVATAFLPRWWAQRVADVVDRSFTAGLFAGLTCGVVFTAAPLLLLRPALRRHLGAGARFAWLGAAALAAVPNLITLGIVLGGNSAAHAGERTMDVEAPWFRGATLVGAVLGAAGVAALWFVLGLVRRQSRELARLRAELRRARSGGSDGPGGGPGETVDDGPDEGEDGDGVDGAEDYGHPR